MKQQEIEEIKAILPDDRTLFYYFKDRYALMLLEYLSVDSVSIAALRRSKFSALLSKPVFKDLLRQAGNGTLSLEQVGALWPASTKVFALTLDQWGDDSRYMQTTRCERNIVLQLNFSNEHREQYYHLLRPTQYAWINESDHPVRHPGSKGFARDTLAWARLDIDLATGEALIEEIQTDFIRDVKHVYQQISKDPAVADEYGVRADQRSFKKYVEEVLSDYSKIWDEAMLAASIDFLVRELGIRQVYYHSWETGLKVKRMYWSRPPRSLYTKLPRRFCFEKTQQTPEFLYKDKEFSRLARALERKQHSLEWYKLPLSLASSENPGSQSLAL